MRFPLGIWALMEKSLVIRTSACYPVHTIAGHALGAMSQIVYELIIEISFVQIIFAKL